MAAPARADERTEARRLFRDGMALVERGNADGIALLEEAYEILPHPHVMYNIARAYAELGLYRESIDAFERYLEWDPADAGEVTEFIASMQEILDRQTREPTVAVTDPTGEEVAPDPRRWPPTQASPARPSVLPSV